MKKFTSITSGIAYAVLLSTPVFAADPAEAPVFDAQSPSLCAVSGVNGKVEAAGGKIDSNGFDGGRFYGGASFSMPLGCAFGLQIDGQIGKLDDESTWSVGGHLFARDPSIGLLGVYGEISEIGDNSIKRIAAEGELYLDRITFSGIAGVEDSDFTDSDFFGAGRVSWYPTDNFQLNVGVAQFLEVTALTFGAEWQPDGSNVSLFAEGAVGDDDHSTVMGGVRFYFGGEQKSLIRRHREDDPFVWFQTLQTLVQNCTRSEVVFNGVRPARDGGRIDDGDPCSSFDPGEFRIR